MSVTDNLRQRIAADGSITFDVFMDIALYGEGGFFASGPLRSAATGDFLTSPEVSPWFGKTIGRFLASHGGVATLVEVGAGSGSLLETLLPELSGSVDTWAVEASPMARDSLADMLDPGRVVAGLGELPERLSGAIVANELIDNLPVALAVRRGSGWVEHAVAASGDGFEFVEIPVRAEVATWADHHGGEVPEGGIVEVQLAAAAWLEAAMDRLERGVILLIDYGGTAEELEPRRQQGTLRTYRGHHLGPDPLHEPGQTDITVDVNFSALVAVAESRGATAALRRQDDFLAEWGLRDAVREMKQRELEAARAGDTMTQLEIRTERIAAETLLHPRGLGDFRVLSILA
ncbi:MAG: SAM-dependent methyltransferase [Acidimicrobiia bacterium]|nr:SAM-dependent methyltransferase [Acidimicrobiia bacterium]